MGKKKRGWHFKKSFLVFSAVFLGLLVILLTSSIAHTVKNKRIEKTSDLPANAGVSNDINSASQTPTESLPVSTSAPPVTAPPVTVPPTTDPNEKVVYLTFDDGPTKNTNKILDILDAYGVKATFFVIHTHDGCEQQIKETHARGHAIGLHSYSHDFSIYSSEETYFDDLNKISDLVYNATGERSKLVRFPGGTSNTISSNYCDGIMSRLAEDVPARGYRYFDWDWDSTDASRNTQDRSVIYENAIRAVDYGDNHVILLMHDAAAKTTTPEALPDIIQYYKDHGYRFDVLSMDSYTYQHNPNN